MEKARLSSSREVRTSDAPWDVLLIREGEITRRLQAYFKHAKSFMPAALDMTIAELEASETAADDDATQETQAAGGADDG